MDAELETETEELETEGSEAAEVPSVREAIQLAMEKSAEASPEAEESAEEPKEDRPRDAAGRFAPKADGVTLDSTSTPPPPIEPPRRVIDPPASWTSEARTKWDSIPADIQEEISRRERERDLGVQRKFEEVSHVVKEKQALDQVFSQYSSVIQQTGLPPAQLVNELLKSHAILMSNPKYGVAQLAKNLGIQPEELSDPGAMQPTFDPRLDALQQQLEGLLRQQQQQIQQQQQARYQRIVDESIKFRTETGADGKPKHPYCAQISERMAPIVEQLWAANPNADPRTILEQVYDEQVYANPETRKAMIAAQAEEIATKRQQEIAAKTAAARKAGASLRGGNGSSANQAAPADVRSAILRARELLS